MQTQIEKRLADDFGIENVLERKISNFLQNQLAFFMKSIKFKNKFL